MLDEALRIVNFRMMKKFLTYYLLGLFCISSLVSCDNEGAITYTVSDATCIVSNVTLGKIPCVIRLKTETGTDSTIVVNVVGADYPMTIDHYAGRIFNVDSLPYGTDVSKVSFYGLASSGTLGINSLYQEGDTLFVATDSTDFRQPRKVTVYAYDGLASRTYNMEVRVHKEDGDSFVWERVCDEAALLQNTSFTGAMVDSESLWVYANKAGAPVLLKAPLNDVSTWTELALNKEIVSPLVLNGTYYAISEGAVVTSVDGFNWEKMESAPANALSIVKVAESIVVATATGFYKSVDGGVWTVEEVDESKYLPTGNVAMVTKQLSADKSYIDVDAVGDAEVGAVVWKHNVDLMGYEEFVWNYYPNGYNNPNPCPTLAERQLFLYDGALLQTGKDELGTTRFYMSNDEGRTWKGQVIPDLKNVVGETIVAIDAKNWIWVVTANGELVRGRYKRMGWAEHQTIFK